MASLGVQARGAREAGMTAFPPQPVPGAPGLRPVFRILLTLLAMLAVAMRPAMAQSILRDAETEALLMNDAGRRVRPHFADTGAFTDHVFAACALLGYRFAPRIPDPDRKSALAGTSVSV